MTGRGRHLRSTADRLGAAGTRALAELSDGEILGAWEGAVAAFLDPGSPERRAVEDDLVRTTGLSPEGLAAGLEAVLGGVRGEPVRRLFTQAQGRERAKDGFALVVLASNLPALAVQPLVAALAARRPVLLKSPSAEPSFAPAFVDALVERLPPLADAVAAAVWPGGDGAVETPLLGRAAVVVAYGDEPALADLERRSREAGGPRGARFVGYGPKTSLAAVGRDADLPAAAVGIARDVALFDQRGCLSVAAVYVEEEREGGARRSRRLADALAEELRGLARRWPPGPVERPGGRADAAAVQQVRAEARMRGLYRPGGRSGDPGETGLTAGTVLIEPEPEMLPTPGLRTVRVHPLAPLDSLPAVLQPWRGRLQGAALAGASAGRLGPGLRRLGISRVTAPGELQSPDVLWHNGGIHPLGAFLGFRTDPSARS